ncbi:MAG TPA: hypothetical protein VF235_06640, partial [Actinomycetota bacterium]
MSDASRRPTGALILLGLVSAVLAETIRVAFPLLYDVRETDGATAAVGWAVALFVAVPLVTPLAVRWKGAERTIRSAAALLAMARIGVQLFDPITLFVIGLAVVGGLVATIGLVHGARAEDRGGAAAVAILAGLALDQAIHGLFA